jgi:hypothetical protein
VSAPALQMEENACVGSRAVIESKRQRGSTSDRQCLEDTVEVKYSDHLRFKMQVREIPEQMPERIYRKSRQVDT